MAEPLSSELGESSESLSVGIPAAGLVDPLLELLLPRILEAVMAMGPLDAAISGESAPSLSAAEIEAGPKVSGEPSGAAVPSDRPKIERFRAQGAVQGASKAIPSGKATPFPRFGPSGPGVRAKPPREAVTASLNKDGRSLVLDNQRGRV